jgi:uncharacterized protein YbaP (TraB family)
MLGAADWEHLLATMSQPPAPGALDRLAPWLVHSLVVQEIHPTPEPIDLSLMERAAADGKSIGFLEDWREQLGVLASTSSLDDLRDLLDADSRSRRALDRLLTSYRGGDLEGISDVLLDDPELALDDDELELLLFERNREWVDGLAGSLADGGVFVAVGVGHFVGRDGLLRLLERRGHTPVRVGPRRG